MQKGVVVSVNVSSKKGTKKTPVGKAAMTGKGFAGDAHSGNWHRQVSLLGQETIDAFKPEFEAIAPGDFAENVTTRGVDWRLARVGRKIRVGKALLEIAQIGKECHRSCEIRKIVGDCAMPREGIFAKVLKPGEVKVGDIVEVID
ncbi:MAG: MOSC domain-containing protein [Euryarchaeota archaeon]|nr:MOSC domain-containing protein [Euryarchaeota archaeon]